MLQGLGEPLHELRQLVKDLSFRNGQEAEMARLEVIERRLDLALKYGVITREEAEELCQKALTDFSSTGLVGLPGPQSNG